MRNVQPGDTVDGTRGARRDDATIAAAVLHAEKLNLLDVLPAAILVTDAAGRCTLTSDRVAGVFGVPAASAIGRSWLEFVDPADREATERRWRSLGEAAELGLAFRVNRADRQAWAAGRIRRVGAGGDAHWFATFDEVTERVESQLDAVRERLFVDAVLDVAASLVIVLDASGRVVRFNAACERLTGWRAVEVVGRPFWAFLIPTAEVDAVRTEFEHLRAHHFPATFENHWVTPSGDLRLIAFSNTCLLDADGEVQYVIGTGIDVTNERQTERAIAAIDAVGRLLSDGEPSGAFAAALVSVAEEAGYSYVALFDAPPELNLAAEAGRGSTAGRAALRRAALRAVETRRPELIRDAEGCGGSGDRPREPLGVIAAPLLDGESVIGVLAIESSAASLLRNADVQLARAVADRFAAAIELRRERRAAAERARMFRALSEMARTVNGLLRSDRLAEELLDAVATVIDGSFMGLTVRDRLTGAFVLRAVRGISPEALGREVRAGEGAAGRAIEQKCLVQTERLGRRDYAPAVRALIPDDEITTIAAPLLRNGVVLGAISVGRAIRAFSDTEREVIDLIGQQLALALENALLVEEVSALAIRDPLTGLYNRRHFDAQVEHLVARWVRARAEPYPVAAIMFDLDHFGRFNLEHGHQIGDAALRAFARILEKRFRASDLVARYGGEEFVAVLERCSVEDACRVADEVRADLESADLRDSDGEPIHATVSAGCGALDPADPSVRALLRAADVGLFLAKRSGRNQVLAA